MTELTQELYETRVEDVPAWITGDITVGDCREISYGGCESGAYMPAVTYWQAAETMAKHGDDVLQYLQDTLDELPEHRNDISWSHIAVFYLSCAVETWARSVLNSREIDV